VLLSSFVFIVDMALWRISGARFCLVVVGLIPKIAARQPGLLQVNNDLYVPIVEGAIRRVK
jgi:hypothetical protein